MATVNPYLNFEGKTEEAFDFYASVFEKPILFKQRFKDTPHGDSMSATDKEKIMHTTLQITDNCALMGTDTLESMGQKLSVGNNFSLAISPDSEADAEKIFDRLAAGGTVQMPLEKVFWGAYFGMVTDKYSIQWMINYELKDEK